MTIQTEYPHIILAEGEVAIIEGSSMKVTELVVENLAYGWTPEELHIQHPCLTLGQIHSAMAYYWDHSAQLDEEIAGRLTRVDKLRQQTNRESSPLVTYESYRAKIDTIYGQLEKILGIKIHTAPDAWDRTYNVDFYIQPNSRREQYVGLQIKLISSGRSLNDHQWDKMHEVNHQKFTSKYGGKVFFIYSVKVGDKKRIHNVEVIEEIRREMNRLK